MNNVLKSRRVNHLDFSHHVANLTYLEMYQMSLKPYIAHGKSLDYITGNEEKILEKLDGTVDENDLHSIKQVLVTSDLVSYLIQSGSQLGDLEVDAALKNIIHVVDGDKPDNKEIVNQISELNKI